MITQDGEQQLVVDDHGKPFKVTAVPAERIDDVVTAYPAFRRMYIGGVANSDGDVNPWPAKNPATFTP
ncbi:hypothetical protein [Streptomyces silvensis]|uniref:Uncharacterized protein n=1 Tax=Streptomyces silvensis TaxID=1765722 RepID=A0A0W7WX64_9ACTN|nr:hypothetical protein [Streptomyces silvensis]KUF15168.1 hypothetical protein AT728_27365 [Streptomyces silvensis]